MEDISIISMVFTAVLVLSCLFLILAPLFKWDSYVQFHSNEQNSAIGKEVLFSTLNELEFEYRMEKISENDYKKLKKQYESQISKVMKTDELKAEKTVDPSILAEVEREIEATMKLNKEKKEGGR
ncbi:hypothetical protein [Bacillus sp. 1NLA3E]|uniref:hypothetical protein n=1 Tax=Bacillus sp. 1NLA3E TaxID=666686 RepID=UPI000247E514|nr:hypothetical protein [Bacillus sp. 1NLA3E]